MKTEWGWNLHGTKDLSPSKLKNPLLPLNSLLDWTCTCWLCLTLHLQGRSACRLQPNIAQPTSLQTDSATFLPSPLLLCFVEVISGAKCAKAPAQPQSTQGLAEPPGIILSEFSGKSITSPCSSPKPRKKMNPAAFPACSHSWQGQVETRRGVGGGSPCRWRASWESSPDPWPLIEAMHPREQWIYMKHLGPQSQNNARRHYKHQTRATQGPQIKHIQCVRSHSQWLPVVLSLFLRLCRTQNILTGTLPRTHSHPRGG